MRTGRCLLLAACVAAGLPPAASAPTRTCNAVPWMFMVDLWGMSPALRARVVAATTPGGGDPEMRARLGNVARAEIHDTGFFPPTALLFYDPVENVQEIADGLNADPAIRSQMVTAASVDGYASCFAVAFPPARRLVVTEYYNRLLDHYFLSSSTDENEFIDTGAAGPGWSRTGESFVTYAPDNCVTPQISKAVYRFFGTPGIGPNSHFFTAGPEECGVLRNGTGWSYEGRAFGAELPVAGVCPANATIPVYRAYNMRSLKNDGNHRHTTSFVTYQQMMARGWYGEGVAFCVPNN